MLDKVTSPAKVAFPKVDGENVFATAIPELKVAQPPSDMSSVRAVIALPPSSPLNNISLSWVDADITKSVELLDNLPNSVPSSFKTTSPPPASNLISSGASIVKSPLPLSVSVT